MRQPGEVARAWHRKISWRPGRLRIGCPARGPSGIAAALGRDGSGLVLLARYRKAFSGDDLHSQNVIRAAVRFEDDERTADHRCSGHLHRSPAAIERCLSVLSQRSSQPDRFRAQIPECRNIGANIGNAPPMAIRPNPVPDFAGREPCVCTARTARRDIPAEDYFSLAETDLAADRSDRRRLDPQADDGQVFRRYRSRNVSDQDISAVIGASSA